MPVAFRIECDGPMADANFYIAGQGALMRVREGINGDSYIVSVGFPAISPSNPLVVNLYSKQKINVMKVQRLAQ